MKVDFTTSRLSLEVRLMMTRIVRIAPLPYFKDRDHVYIAKGYRYVAVLNPLADADHDELISWVGENLHHYKFSRSKMHLYLGERDAVHFKLRFVG